MPTWMIMPKLGINMTKGEIVNWLVGEGDSVQKGQTILEIETDKALQEVEAPESGILAKIVAQPGETVPCTYVIAVITQPGEPVPETIPRQDEIGVVPESSVEAGAGGKDPEPEGAPARAKKGKDRILITPAARKLAKDLGVDVSTVKGSGPRGRIGKDDIQRAAEKVAPSSASPATTPAAGQVVRVAGVRAIIAERMLQSAQGTARVFLMADADATQLVAWREHLRRDRPEQAGVIGYNELLVAISARALGDFPYMNATLREDGIHMLEEINVGVAVDSERGLLVPVIKGADRKGVFQIHEEFIALAEAARSGHSNPDDLTGGTFTITNLGMYEIDTFAPIINPPEIAILGVGQIAPRPVAVGEQVVVQKRMTLSLAFDHRLVDGAPAARFLQRIKQLIEAPYMLNTQ
jgi:pyruvate dehydrogenase E2 component (dihydrolipoamide acetyltransferase)